MRKIWGLLVAGLIMSVVCALAFSANAQEVTIALGSEPTTLDPQLREDGGERAVNDNIYETLVARTPNGTLVPGLAEVLPKLVDPESWEVKLRPGIKFHDGTPFNADAVVFSVKRIINPKFNSEQISFFFTITDAKKIDDLTVRVLTKLWIQRGRFGTKGDGHFLSIGRKGQCANH